MGSRVRILLVLLICLRFPVPLLAQSAAQTKGEMVVVTASQEQAGQVVTPRSIQMAVFLVDNYSDTAISVTPEFSLPQGWRVIMPPFPLTVAPQASEAVYCSYQVPETALGGEQDIICRLPVAGMEPLEAVQTVFVEYLYDLSVQTILSELYVQAGQQYSYDIIIKNTSNREVDIQLAYEDPQDLDITLSEDPFFLLQPQESKKILVTVETKASLEEEIEHIVTYSAQIVGMEISKEVKASVKIIPVEPGESSWHHYPLTLSVNSKLSHSGELTHVSSFSLSGNGTLFDDGSHAFNFTITPPAFPSDSFNWADTKLSFSYEQKGLYLYTGTSQSYGLTGVSIGNVSGLGIGLQYKKEGTRFESFLVEPVTATGVELEQFGVGLIQEFEDIAKVSFGYIAPMETPETGSIGFKCSMVPYGTASLSGSTVIKASNPAAFMYQLSASESQQVYDYSISRTFKSPEYADTEYGIDTYSIRGSFKMLSQLKLTGSFSRNMNNLALTNVLDTAVTNQTLNISGYWYPTSVLTIQLEQEQFKQWDLLQEQSLNLVRDTTSLRSSWRAGKFSIAPSYSYRSVKSLLSSTDNYASIVARLNSDYSFSPRTSLSSTLTYDSGSNERGTGDSMVTGTLAFFTSPNSHVRFSSSYVASVYPYDQQNSFSSIQATVSYQNEEFGSLSCSLLREMKADAAENKTTVSIAYNNPIRINVPVSLRSDIGSISGLVYNRETGEPVVKALVTAGALSVLTDSEGRYRFKAIPPGDIEIKVSSPELGSQYIVYGTYPITLTVEAEQDYVIDIPMIRKATLSGRLIRMDEKPGTSFFMAEPQFEENGGFGGLVVEITSEFGTRREATNIDGSFEFTAIPPGRVSFKVFTEQLPATHALKENEFTFELAPGEHKNLDLLVKQIVRRVQFMQQEVVNVQ